MLSRSSDENPGGIDAILPSLHGGRDMESQALLAASDVPSSPADGHRNARPGRSRGRCNARVAEGALLLLLVNIIWVASSEVVQVGSRSRRPRLTPKHALMVLPWLQYIYKDLDFNKPFFLTYVSNSLFMLLFPMQFGVEKLRQKGICVPALAPSSPPPAPLKQVRFLRLQ
jgi:hypothetical protein